MCSESDLTWTWDDGTLRYTNTLRHILSDVESNILLTYSPYRANRCACVSESISGDRT